MMDTLRLMMQLDVFPPPHEYEINAACRTRSVERIAFPLRPMPKGHSDLLDLKSISLEPICRIIESSEPT